MPKASVKTRVTLDLTPHFYQRLESLEMLSGASSKAEVLRFSLQVYEYILSRTAMGYSFHTTAPNGSVESVAFVGCGPVVAKSE